VSPSNDRKLGQPALDQVAQSQLNGGFSQLLRQLLAKVKVIEVELTRRQARAPAVRRSLSGPARLAAHWLRVDLISAANAGW
jgi:hypothetical protein